MKKDAVQSFSFNIKKCFWEIEDYYYRSNILSLDPTF